MSSSFCVRKPNSPPSDSSRIRLGALAFRSAASVHRGRVRNAEKRIHAPAPPERQKTRNQILTCLIEIAELSACYYRRPQPVLIPADPLDRTAFPETGPPYLLHLVHPKHLRLATAGHESIQPDTPN